MFRWGGGLTKANDWQLVTESRDKSSAKMFSGGVRRPKETKA